MARRKAPQRRCREASKGSLEAKADQEPSGEAVGPSRCQTSGSAGTRLELVTRFWESSPGSATQGFAKWRNEATKIAWIVFSLTCRGAGALVSLWTCLPSVSVFAMYVVQEQICGSAIERKIQSDYQALLVAQNQNMRRLLQEVAQLRVQLISARKAASEAASQVSVEMSDWALQSAGAAIDTRRTSQTYGCQGNWICGVIQLFHAANPPEAVLQDICRISNSVQVTCIKLAFQLENAKLSSDENNKVAGAAREELKEALMRIEALSYQLSVLQKQASTAEDRIRELEETMAGEREKIRKMLDAKEREMTDMRDQMQQQPTEYPLQLLDVTLTVGAYGKLMKGEEGNSTSVRMALPERDLYPPQKICTAWQQTRSVGGGLYNLGNTCYLNSILQCLTYTPPLANYLLSRQHSQSCEKKGFCMMCTMEVHVEEVLSCSGSAVAPVAVVRELPLTCWSCKAVSDTYKAFRDISLDIRKATSVTRALKDFVRPKHLNGKNSYRCSKCEQRVSVSRRLTIHQASNILTVRLKRVDPFSGRKITKVVRYPEYLEIGKYTSEASGGPLLYSLYAVVIHEGHSCQRGHYYCFVKASDRQWYRMDDASVVLCDIQTVLSRCAYLLFYVRRHDLTPRAGAERQETQSAGLAKSVQDAKNPFSGGFVAPRKPEALKGKCQNGKKIKKSKASTGEEDCKGGCVCSLTWQCCQPPCQVFQVHGLWTEAFSTRG
ncbi:hypothetical protein Q9966_003871 [Columba livia]|nr:hypothetical protein Q9966_003871 [Columba livia]